MKKRLCGLLALTMSIGMVLSVSTTAMAEDYNLKDANNGEHEEVVIYKGDSILASDSSGTGFIVVDSEKNRLDNPEAGLWPSKLTAILSSGQKVLDDFESTGANAGNKYVVELNNRGYYGYSLYIGSSAVASDIEKVLDYKKLSSGGVVLTESPSKLVETMGARAINLCMLTERPITYKLKLDANKGTLAQTAIEVKTGSDTLLPVPTREGYIFTGWNTKADGTGDAIISLSRDANSETIGATALAAGLMAASYTFTADSLANPDTVVTTEIPLYAQWNTDPNYVAEKNDTDTNGSEDTNTDNDNAGSNTTDTSSDDAPNTSDATDVFAKTVVLFVAAICVIGIVVKRRKEDIR